MGVFDELIGVNEKGGIFSKNWIEWEHFMIPNKPQWLRDILRNLMALEGHCLTCTSVDGCFFIANNMPERPLHPHCDCKQKGISYSIVQTKAHAVSGIEKFRDYVFAPKHFGKGKVALFKEWGYTIDDSEELRNTYAEQALLAYKSGQYKRKKLDEHGQQLAIPVSLNAKKFYSGWMLRPEGEIVLITPFGGWIK